jgi:hypothetical protein
MTNQELIDLLSKKSPTAKVVLKVYNLPTFEEDPDWKYFEGIYDIEKEPDELDTISIIAATNY